MIANRLERSRDVRSNSYIRRCAGLDILVDLQWPNHKTMRDIIASQLECDRLTLDQGDTVGREMKLARRYFDDRPTRFSWVGLGAVQALKPTIATAVVTAVTPTITTFLVSLVGRIPTKRWIALDHLLYSRDSRTLSFGQNNIFDVD
jgi:hypothetical protein